MHIMMTTDSVGGVFVYSLELSRALLARGHSIHLVVLGRSLTRAQRAELRALHELEVEEIPGALEWMDDAWDEVDAAGRLLLAAAERVRPDCVHLNEYAHGALPWSVPVLMVGHSCVLSWWQAVKGEPAPARYDTYRERVRSGLSGAARVIAPSRAMLEQLTRWYGPLPHGSVIPNAIALNAFAGTDKRPLILCAGRLWDEAKNVSTLAAVAPQLDLPVYLAGEHTSPEGRQLALGGCHPLGPLSRQQLSEVLARAGIYAMPARYEPFGLSVLEAAASGCALVLGRIPSLLEHWAGAALLVDPNDPQALHAALAALIAEPDLRRELSTAAQVRARSFDVGGMAAAYEHAYAQLALAGREAVQCAS